MQAKTEVFIKFFALIGFAIIIATYFLTRYFILGSFGIGSVLAKNDHGNITYQTPYQSTLDSNFGTVIIPRITLPLKTEDGYVNTSFLLDSGAAVSTLPLDSAKKIGIDLTNSKRIALQGFTGVPSFAYLDTITVQIADQEFKFPATFSDSNSNLYILGRKGLFDDFTVNFDHEKDLITLTKKAGT